MENLEVHKALSIYTNLFCNITTRDDKFFVLEQKFDYILRNINRIRFPKILERIYNEASKEATNLIGFDSLREKLNRFIEMYENGEIEIDMGFQD